MSKLIRVEFATAAGRRPASGSNPMGEEIAALGQAIDRALGQVDRLLHTLRRVEDED